MCTSSCLKQFTAPHWCATLNYHRLLTIKQLSNSDFTSFIFFKFTKDHATKTILILVWYFIMFKAQNVKKKDKKIIQARLVWEVGNQFRHKTETPQSSLPAVEEMRLDTMAHFEIKLQNEKIMKLKYKGNFPNRKLSLWMEMFEVNFCTQWIYSEEKATNLVSFSSVPTSPRLHRLSTS